MDNQVLLLLLVIAVIVACVFYPGVFGIQREGFEEKNQTDTKTESNNQTDTKTESNNPKMYQVEMSKEVEKTPIVGLPNEFFPAWGDDSYKYGDFDVLNDGANGNMGMGFNLCSKSCCSTQYPPPFGLPVDPLVCGSKKEFLPSIYTCNNGWQDSGCLCVTKEQTEFLNSRGKNA
jgi:hypothetical protein